MALRLTQPLMDISAKRFRGERGGGETQLVRKADNLTAICL
jgi:hypothetical protein